MKKPIAPCMSCGMAASCNDLMCSLYRNYQRAYKSYQTELIFRQKKMVDLKIEPSHKNHFYFITGEPKCQAI